MADIKSEIKRGISEEFDDLHDEKKQQYTKPGRKPIDTEPKSKRTAQNRAAQRAYRERKERRMKELEDKVKSLEDQNIQVTTESDFLKAQVDLLKNELARYRGYEDFSDLNLPTKVGRLSNPQKKNTSVSSSTSSSSASNVAVEFPWSNKNLNQQKYNLQNLPDLTLGGTTGSTTGSSSSSSPLDAGITGNTSTTSSTHNKANDNKNGSNLGLVSPDSNSSASYSNPNTVNSNIYDGIDYKFEEQADPFCAELNSACGTKECPVPKYKAPSIQSIPTTISSGSPFQTLINAHNNNSSLTNSSNTGTSLSSTSNNNIGNNNYSSFLNDTFFNGEGGDFNFPIKESVNSTNVDPLSFLNDNDNFDVSLAFGDNYTKDSPGFDPISLLTTEESVYDPLKDEANNKRQSVSTNSAVNGVFDFNDYIQTKSSGKPTVSTISPEVNSATNPLAEEDDDDNDVVPAPEETVRCSEIWDRITSHPRYTDIDIDSLCNELKSKAKCSEKGVVINSSDVKKLLEESVMKS